MKYEVINADVKSKLIKPVIVYIKETMSYCIIWYLMENFIILLIIQAFFMYKLTIYR